MTTTRTALSRIAWARPRDPAVLPREKRQTFVGRPTNVCLAALLCLAAGPGFAATCHMTVRGVPVIDDRDCAAAGRRNDVTITDDAGDTIRIRRSAMTASFIPRGADAARRRAVRVAFGRVIATSDSEDKTCYYNQKATLCVDP